MTTKWEINRAVRASKLPAPSRLIMLTLSDIAEVGTAEIPERLTPSLRVLAEETGLGESTVKRHLNELEWRFDPDTVTAFTPPRQAARDRGCDMQGCDRPHHGLGLCRMHYKRQAKPEQGFDPIDTEEL